LWGESGDASRLRCAFGEAQVAYQSALAILGTLTESRERDERELALQTSLATALQITKGYSAPETVEASARARALAAKIKNPGKLLLQTTGAWAALSSAGDFAGASRIADEMLDLASRDGNVTSLAYAHMAKMTSRYRLGDLAGSENYFVRGRAFFDHEGFRRGPGAIAQTFGNASQVAFLMGHADKARNRIGHAISIAHANENPYDEAFAQFMAAMLHLFLREPEQAESCATHSLSLSDKHKFPQFAAIARIALGRARAELGDARSGVELIGRGMAEMIGTRNRNAITVYLHWLAEGQTFNGEISEAITSAEKALTENEAELFFRPENLRLRADLWLRQGNAKLAEDGFHDAINFARRIEARISELRATTHLSRLLAQQGRVDEAREIVSEIYSWFTEGLDNLSLKEARDLLTELGPSGQR